MTDFLESALNSMSSAFNSSPTPGDGASVIDLNLNDDKTLKWRSLYNNSNAVKSNKKVNEQEPIIKEKITQGQDNNNIDEMDDKKKIDLIKKPNDDHQDLNQINTRRRKNLQIKTEKSEENSVSASRRSRRSRVELLSGNEEIKKNYPTANKNSKKRRRNRKINSNSRDNSPEKQINENDIKLETDMNKEISSVTNTESINDSIQQSSIERKLRRSERNSIPDEIEAGSLVSIKPLNENNLDGNEIVEPKGKKIRRSERLESRYEVEEIAAKISALEDSVDIKDDKKKSSEIIFISAENVDEENGKNSKSNLNEIIPKRRRRRAKTESITPEKCSNMELTSNSNKKQLRGRKDSSECVGITAVVKKEKINEQNTVPSVPISQRPLRRIKPTVKILENEELRYEFETKNIARITACSETLNSFIQTEQPLNQNLEITNNRMKREQKEDKDKDSPKSPSSVSKSSIQQISGAEETKKKVFVSCTESNLSFDNIYPVSSQRPCPDPQTFLSEIKAAKINLHKSPENKKLNKKQQRKLLKQKEKHLEKLGLRKKVKEDKTETEDSLSDNEEFLPPKKVNVGKPNVTLRLRNKENSPESNETKSQFKAKLKKRNKLQTSRSNPANKLCNTKISNGANNSESLCKNNSNEKSMICLCRKQSQYYIRNTPDTAFCSAIDSIEDEKVGCCNQLDGKVLNLLRPSHRVGYMIFCDEHKKRLLAHNCCATCGIFCTQGKFILCKQEHFFHSECAQKYILNTPYDPTNTNTTYPSPILVLKCPHCGCDTPQKTSLVTMKCNTMPVFLPTQRVLMKAAKMTVPEGDLGGKLKYNLPSIIEMHKLIPESVMNIASQRHTENTRNDTNNEFSSKDMFYAINNDDLERVAEIIASGYDITCEMPEFLNGTCLHLVAHFGTIQMAYLLLCRESSANFLNMIDKELRTPVMCTIIGDKCDILKLFIQCGADLSLKGSDGMTCLHMAAKIGNLAATQLIVESYKNCTNIMNFKKLLDAQDDGGWTAIVWAAENGFTDIVSYLISHGADSNICDTENNSVLHWATLSNRVETIMILLQANTNCNQQNINGDTSLHIACRQSATRICLILIANGADLMVKNKANELPYDCIPSEESQCARAVGFNMQMRSFGPSGLINKIVCSDISNGREIHPIQAIRGDKITKSRNDQCDDDIILPDFKYIVKSILLQNSVQIDQRISQMRICSCNDGCNTDQCQCSSISVQNWYTQEGRLNNEFYFDDPPMIFECNDVCGCNKLVCKNRVVQSGIKIPLQIFECEKRLKGWGVRSLVQIPRGTFISEYTGEILTDLEADRRTDDSYFFDLGASDHCIDANYYGNVSRFFNHSCSPNIVPVRVYYDHQDYRFPKIAFFACKDIQAGEELCFDYGEKFWAIKQKYFSCQCMSSDCRYSNIITNTNTNENSISNLNTSNNINNINTNKTIELKNS